MFTFLTICVCEVASTGSPNAANLTSARLAFAQVVVADFFDLLELLSARLSPNAEY